MKTASKPSKPALILGDVHGNLPWFRYACEIATLNDAGVILQLGDFGYWEHQLEGVDFIDGVAAALRKHSLRLIFIDGNHENHPLLWSRYVHGVWFGHGYRRSKRHPSADGQLFRLRPRLWYAPRGARFSLSGRQFLACGGAYSIDKPYRVKGMSWWPEELITEDDVEACNAGRTDYLLSHDAPSCGQNVMDLLPFGRNKDFPLTTQNREQLQRVVDYTKPAMVLHGHYHVRYSEDTINTNAWPNRRWLPKLQGFDCDGRPGSMGLLQVETGVISVPKVDD